MGKNATIPHAWGTSRGLTYAMEKTPLWLPVCTERMVFIWETSTWRAAAVVNPPTRGSDRYRTRKPTCRSPITTWKDQHGPCSRDSPFRELSQLCFHRDVSFSRQMHERLIAEVAKIPLIYCFSIMIFWCKISVHLKIILTFNHVTHYYSYDFQQIVFVDSH